MKGILRLCSLIVCECDKINLNRGGSYIDSPDWIKTKNQQPIPPIKKIADVFNMLWQSH